jgi:nitrous oxidase accessory protein NosD
MGNLEACNNIIDSASEGMYLDYYSLGETVSQNAMYTMGDILVNDNTITSGNDGIYVYEIDDLGYDVDDNAVYTVGNIEFQRNTIDAGDDGIYFDYITDVGYDMNGDSTCIYGDFLV